MGLTREQEHVISEDKTARFRERSKERMKVRDAERKKRAGIAAAAQKVADDTKKDAAERKEKTKAAKAKAKEEHRKAKAARKAEKAGGSSQSDGDGSQDGDGDGS